jgi:hypothetical protein
MIKHTNEERSPATGYFRASAHRCPPLRLRCWRLLALFFHKSKDRFIIPSATFRTPPQQRSEDSRPLPPKLNRPPLWRQPPGKAQGRCNSPALLKGGGCDWSRRSRDTVAARGQCQAPRCEDAPRCDGRNLTLYLWAPKIALGSAPAAGAVFRALAENLVTTE